MDATNIALIANIGEIIAAVTVVVSLIYVALQIRQNTDVLKITAAQAYVGIYNTFTSDLITSEVAGIWYKGVQDFASLKDSEVVQFSALAGQVMRIFESAFSQWRRGALEDQLWLANVNSIRDSLAMSGLQQWWQFRKLWYSEDFRQFVDDLADKGDVHPIYPGLSTERQ